MEIFAAFCLMLGTVLSLAAVITITSLINGVVIHVLWGWFIVPTFHTQDLSVVAAMGLGLFISWVTSRWSTKKSETDWGYLMSQIIVQPLFVLGWGWILHNFI